MLKVLQTLEPLANSSSYESPGFPALAASLKEPWRPSYDGDSKRDGDGR